MIEVILIEEKLADLLFIIYCLTALPCGIIAGGAINKKIGGYDNINSTIMLTILISLTGGISILLAFVSTETSFCIVFWIFLFSGAQLVPNLGGGILSSLPLSLKGSGYSLNIIVSNLLGYAPAPYVYAIVFDSLEKSYPRLPLSLCFGSACFIGFICMITVYYIRIKNPNSIIDEEYVPEEVIEKIMNKNDEK